MPVTVRWPGSLRDAVGGADKLTADGTTLAEVFADIERRHPGFRERFRDERGHLRAYVNVYIGDTDARASGGLDARVAAGTEVMVIPAMAGGRREPSASPQRSFLRRPARRARLAAWPAGGSLPAPRTGPTRALLRPRSAPTVKADKYATEPLDLTALKRAHSRGPSGGSARG